MFLTQKGHTSNLACVSFFRFSERPPYIIFGPS
nr:MAG TPA: hypothetical protein [Bacteriophage sp.]